MPSSNDSTLPTRLAESNRAKPAELCASWISAWPFISCDFASFDILLWFMMMESAWIVPNCQCQFAFVAFFATTPGEAQVPKTRCGFWQNKQNLWNGQWYNFSEKEVMVEQCCEIYLQEGSRFSRSKVFFRLTMSSVTTFRCEISDVCILSTRCRCHSLKTQSGSQGP